MADFFPRSFTRLSIDFTGGLFTTSYDVFRSDVGPITVTNPGVQIGFDIPLLGEQGVFVDDTAPLGVPLWWSIVADTGGVQTFLVSSTPGGDLAWLKDPFRPWADIAFDFCTTDSQGHKPNSCSLVDPEFVWGGLGPMDWDSDAGLFEVLNSETPADVFARRKYAAGSLVFFTRELENINTVYELFTAGGPLLMQLPSYFGQKDIFIQPGTLSMSYIASDQRRPERRWEAPFVVVDRPIGPVQGIDCNNWCEIDTAFPTYAQVAITAGTWHDVLFGSVLCPPGFEDGFGIGPFGDGPFGDGG